MTMMLMSFPRLQMELGVVVQLKWCCLKLHHHHHQKQL